MTEKIFQKGFKDLNGNTAVFTNENGKIFIDIDGGDCSEGVCEEITKEEDIFEVLNWYGYVQLASEIKSFLDK